MHVQQETWFADAGDDREDPTLVWTGSRIPITAFDTAPPTPPPAASLVLRSVIGGLALFGAAIIMRGLVLAAAVPQSNVRAELPAPPARTALATQPAPEASPVPPPAPAEDEDEASTIATSSAEAPAPAIEAESMPAVELEPMRNPIARAHSRRAHHARKAMHASAPGTLRINSLPWAEVYVDGTLVGHTPQSSLSMKPGRHRVKLVNEQMALSKTFDVHIESGRVTTRSENLSL